MRILFLNMSRFGGLARIRQPKDYITKEKLDIVGIQETIKHDFSDFDLHDIAGNLGFQ